MWHPYLLTVFEGLAICSELTKLIFDNFMRLVHTWGCDVQGVLSKYISQLRTNTARYTDERVRLAGEVIAGSLAVKMLGKPSSPG